MAREEMEARESEEEMSNTLGSGMKSYEGDRSFNLRDEKAEKEEAYFNK